MTKKNIEEETLRRTVIEPARSGFGVSLKELWYYRELTFMLAAREIHLRYKQTFLGVAWVILQPLITTVLFTIIFGRLMKTQSDDVSYELFAFVGLLPWNVFSQSLQRAGASLTRDIRLITKIFFPRILIPIANSLSTLVDFLVSLGILAFLLVIYRSPISWNIMAIPILLIFNILLSIGVGIIFAALNVYYRDFTYVLPFVIQVWMYASPLAYSSNLIPTNFSWIYNLNPMVGIIDGFRWAVFGTIAFPTNSLIYSIFASVGICLIGLILFHRLEHSFADVI